MIKYDLKIKFSPQIAPFTDKQLETLYKNIPILPEAFLTFASKSSCGPSYVANGQKDHKTYTNLNDDTVIGMA